MPAIVRWPCSWAPISLDLRLVNLAVSGGRSLSGAHRAVLHDAPYWRGSYSWSLSGSAQIVAARAVMAMAQGPVNDIILPAFDCSRSPGGAANGWRMVRPRVPHSDESLFSDETAYVSGVYAAHASFAAAARGVTLSITWPPALPAPMPGQYFSVADRLHLIHSVTAVTTGAATLGFSPPLRSAVTAGDEINFDSPRGTFRLVPEQATGIGPIDRLRWGTLTIEVEEPL